jgi:hypothetical protein
VASRLTVRVAVRMTSRLAISMNIWRIPG